MNMRIRYAIHHLYPPLIKTLAGRPTIFYTFLLYDCSHRTLGLYYTFMDVFFVVVFFFLLCFLFLLQSPWSLPSLSFVYGFDNCSFLKNNAKPMQMMICISKASQKPAFPRPSEPKAKLGKTLPGPVLSGAVRRATIVAIEPSTCAAINVKQIWKRVIVCNKIIPKPTPCSASSTPNHSHRQRPSIAEAIYEPAQGREAPIPEVPQSI